MVLINIYFQRSCTNFRPNETVRYIIKKICIVSIPHLWKVASFEMIMFCVWERCPTFNSFGGVFVFYFIAISKVLRCVCVFFILKVFIFYFIASKRALFHFIIYENVSMIHFINVAKQIICYTVANFWKGVHSCTRACIILMKLSSFTS